MQYGAHSSANDHKEFLRDKLADMVEAGHLLVLKYSSVRYATDLRISPLGVVPQRDCQPRPIVDYTFSSVNKATVKLAPPESMQFAKALDRMIQKAADANSQHGTVNLSKYDLADAFMRVGLSPSMILKLAVVVPTTSPDEDPLIAVPMVLPMGVRSHDYHGTKITGTKVVANSMIPRNTNSTNRSRILFMVVDLVLSIIILVFTKIFS